VCKGIFAPDQVTERASSETCSQSVRVSFGEALSTSNTRQGYTQKVERGDRMAGIWCWSRCRMDVQHGRSCQPMFGLLVLGAAMTMIIAELSENIHAPERSRLPHHCNSLWNLWIQQILILCRDILYLWPVVWISMSLVPSLVPLVALSIPRILWCLGLVSNNPSLAFGDKSENSGCGWSASDWLSKRGPGSARSRRGMFPATEKAKARTKCASRAGRLSFRDILWGSFD